MVENSLAQYNQEDLSGGVKKFTDAVSTLSYKRGRNQGQIEGRKSGFRRGFCTGVGICGIVIGLGFTLSYIIREPDSLPAEHNQIPAVTKSLDGDLK